MTDAPERIWMDPVMHQFFFAGDIAPACDKSKLVEYIRADKVKPTDGRT